MTEVELHPGLTPPDGMAHGVRNTHTTQPVGLRARDYAAELRDDRINLTRSEFTELLTRATGYVGLTPDLHDYWQAVWLCDRRAFQRALERLTRAAPTLAANVLRLVEDS